MALTYNFENVKDHDSVVWREDDSMDPKVQAVIFMTMFTGINEITEGNAAEFYARAATIEKLDGAHTYKIEDGKREEDPLTPEDVRKLIGLHTNASPLTRAQFLNKIKDQLKNSMNAHLRSYEREQDKTPA